MTLNLIFIGLVVIPFYEIIIKLLPFSQCITADTREAKAFLLMLFSVGCFCLHLIEGKNIRLSKRSKLIPIMVFFIFYVSHLWWKMPFQLNDVDYTSFWKWKPMVEVLSAFLLFITASQYYKYIDEIFNIIIKCGLILSIYAIIQSFGVDQFYLQSENPIIKTVPSFYIVGNLGQPTLLAPYLALSACLAWIVDKKYISIICAISCILTKSMVGIGSMICGYIFIFLDHVRLSKSFNILRILFIFILISTAIFVIKDGKWMSGRKEVWKRTIIDVSTNPFKEDNLKRYSFTGVGLGSYAVIFSAKNDDIKTKFNQAHNEYLDFFYACGLFGLILLIMSLFNSFKMSSDIRTSTSMVVLCLCAFGTFIWQLGVYQYITTIIIALIHGGENEKNQVYSLNFNDSV